MSSLARVWVLAAVLFTAVSARAATVPGDEAERQKLADRLLDTLLHGIAQRDYDVFSEFIDRTFAEAVPEAQFGEFCQKLTTQMGAFQNRSYLGSLDQGEMTVFLWKARFANSTNDVLIRLSVSLRDGDYEITGLLYQ